MAEEFQEATALSLSSVAWVLFPSPYFSFIEKTKVDRKRIGLMSSNPSVMDVDAAWIVGL